MIRDGGADVARINYAADNLHPILPGKVVFEKIRSSTAKVDRPGVSLFVNFTLSNLFENKENNGILTLKIPGTLVDPQSGVVCGAKVYSPPSL